MKFIFFFVANKIYIQWMRRWHLMCFGVNMCVEERQYKKIIRTFVTRESTFALLPFFFLIFV
jgi:hypothetical protein